MYQYSHYRGLRRRREKGPEKIFEEIIAENFLNMGKEIVNQVQEPQNPWKDKPKEEHTKTHSNQTEKKLQTEIKYKKQQGKSDK